MIELRKLARNQMLSLEKLNRNNLQKLEDKKIAKYNKIN